MPNHITVGEIHDNDESRYQMLQEDGKTPQSQSYIWVQRGGPPDSPVNLYDYDPTRSQAVPLRLLDKSRHCRC